MRTHLLSLRSNRVNLVDEDDGRAVLLGLLERLPEVRLGLSGHLGHDLRTVDEEEEGTSLVGDGSGHEGLSRSRRSEHEDTSWGLDSDGLEELGVAKRQLDKLSDLGHLLPATSNVVVTDVGEVVLLVLSLDGVTLSVDDSILGNDAEF